MVVVKNKKERPTGHSSIGAGCAGQLYLSVLFHRFIRFVFLAGVFTNVSTKHIPTKTTELAKAVWDQLYKHLSDHEKERLRKLSKTGLEVKIGAEGASAVAVKFGVIVYDSFKEYLGGLTAVTMDSPDNEMEWHFSPAYLFKFEKYGVVGIYVR